MLGVVHAPALGETFVSPRALEHIVLGDAGTGQERLCVALETEDLGDAVLATGFPYRRGELEHSNLENFRPLLP